MPFFDAILGFVPLEEVGVSGLSPGGEEMVEPTLEATLKGMAVAVEVGPT